MRHQGAIFEFHPTIELMTTTSCFSSESSKIIELETLHPGPILTFALIVTLGPILAVGSMFEVGWM